MQLLLRNCIFYQLETLRPSLPAFRLCVKDKHARAELEMANASNPVWHHFHELPMKVLAHINTSSVLWK
jgi:hypothetical protein